MWSHGNFYWNELMTHDVQRSKKFYENVIGWQFEPMSMDGMTYWVAKEDGDSVGGMFEMQGPEFETVPEHWTSYIAVDDVDGRVQKAVAAGGKALREPFDIPNVGRIAILRDSVGAVIALITPTS